MNDFLTGIGYLFRGYKTIFRPGLRRYFFLPLFINTATYIGLIWFAINQFDGLMALVMPEGDAWWLSIAQGLLWVVFAIAISVAMFFTFTMVMNILGSPFNSFLAEKVEQKVCGNIPMAISWSRRLREALRSVLSELRKYLHFLWIALLILVATFIPVINIGSPVMWLLFWSWTLAAEYIAYPMNNHGMFFTQVRQQLQQRRALTYGFGVAAFFMSLIPVVNFFVMPAAVTGGTLLWYERLRQ